MNARKPIRVHTDWDAPLPLAYQKAVAKGLELHALPSRPSSRVIADVMRIYHGFDRGEAWWRDHLRAAGATPRPRGFTLDTNATNRGANARQAA